jgi:NADH-quinone oxidoreductase subunit J
MIIDLILLSALLLAVLWTVMTVRLLRSVLGLALTSVILSVLIYRLNSPWAAVFELSVCAGLIPVFFITAVSFTRPISNTGLPAARKERSIRFWYLPFIVIGVGLLLSVYLKTPGFDLPGAVNGADVRVMLWNLRRLDLLGQLLILLAGAFGVVVLFKETKE